MFPKIIRMIEKYQRKDKALVAKLKCTNYYAKYFLQVGIVIQMENLYT